MSARQLHVLITGGAGFVGRHLAAALIAEGHTVRVLDNLSRSSATDLRRLAPDAELISGDIRDAVAVAAAARDSDVVYHLAAISTVTEAERDSGRTFEVNIQGTFTVIRAARDDGVGRVVLASSREVYGRPRTLPVREGAAIEVKPRGLSPSGDSGRGLRH